MNFSRQESFFFKSISQRSYSCKSLFTVTAKLMSENSKRGLHSTSLDFLETSVANVKPDVHFS